MIRWSFAIRPEHGLFLSAFELSIAATAARKTVEMLSHIGTLLAPRACPLHGCDLSSLGIYLVELV